VAPHCNTVTLEHYHYYQRIAMTTADYDELWINQLKDSPNYDFYVDKICVCPRQTLGYTERNNPYHPESEPFTCLKCGKVDRSSLWVCTYCTSVFYNWYQHPYKPIGSQIHACWNCVNSEEVIHSRNEVYERFNTVGPKPPPDYLLNPVTVPPTITELFESIDFGEW
jgi:hypothetical protein